MHKQAIQQYLKLMLQVYTSPVTKVKHTGPVVVNSDKDSTPIMIC